MDKIPEPNRLEQKRLHLIGLYEQHLARGVNQLAVCVAAVDEAQRAVNALFERHGLELLNAVAIQVERIGTVDLELSLWEPHDDEDTQPAEQPPASRQLFDIEAFRELLAHQQEAARAHTRSLGLAWGDLTVANRAVLRQGQVVGSTPDPQEEAHQEAVSGWTQSLRELRESHQLEQLACLQRIDALMPGLERRLERLDPEEDELVVCRLDAMAADLARIRTAQGGLEVLVQQQNEQRLRQDSEMYTLRKLLLQTQLDQDELTARLEALRAM